MSQNTYSQQLSYRRATEQDLPSILKLLVEDELGKKREFLNKESEQYYLEAFKKIDADFNHYLMVIELENKLVGTCHLTLLPSLTFRGVTRLQVESVHVAESFRGNGVGR